MDKSENVDEEMEVERIDEPFIQDQSEDRFKTNFRNNALRQLIQHRLDLICGTLLLEKSM